MEMYAEAKEDAAESVKLMSTIDDLRMRLQHPKALFRLARAQLALEEYGDAIETVDRALTFCEEQLTKEKLKKNHDSNDDGERIIVALASQGNEFQKLLKIAKQKQQQSRRPSTATTATATQTQGDIQSIKLQPQTPSIRELLNIFAIF